MARKCLDCRDFPELHCCMYMSGEADDLLRAMAAHQIEAHSATAGEQLNNYLRSGMKDEPAFGMPATAAAGGLPMSRTPEPSEMARTMAGATATPAMG